MVIQNVILSTFEYACNYDDTFLLVVFIVASHPPRKYSLLQNAKD